MQHPAHRIGPLAVAILLLVTGATRLSASGGIAATTINPSAILVNAPTEVSITATITDASLIPGSVNLQRFDPIGRVFSVVSTMYDDGTHGDAVANDGIFTIRLSFNESSPFPVVLRVSAAFKGSLTRAFSNPFNLGVTGLPATSISIASPPNLSFVNASPVTVSGTVSDANAALKVNGVATVASGGRFSVSVPLLEGPNTITAVTTNSQGTSSTASVQVTLDTTPPKVTIDSPFNGYITADPTITVTGKVNDIVIGTVNPQQVRVSVNGVSALVSNRSFEAASIPLSVGNNTIAANAVDRAGNAASFSIVVTRVPPGQPRITIVSGNNQTGPVSTALAQPLVVQVLDGAGAPIPAQTVVFAVTQNNGLLNGSSAPKSILTDSLGKAQAVWTLGSRAGSVNLVQAGVAGIPGNAIFTAAGVGGMPAKIVVDAGGQQTGATGQQLPNPLAVVVTDAAHNRLSSVPVTFQVKKGGGNFAGQQSLTINTDSDGRALATLTMGPNDGIANNLVEANFLGNSGLPAAFSLSGRTPGAPAATVIKGVVLDNSNTPVPGATVRAYLENVPAQVSAGLPPSATATSDVHGQFFIQPAPVGFVKLLVDGSTIKRPGKWPNLEYELVTVAGQINTLGMPVYLLPIDTVHQLCVSDTVGGSLNLPQVPGFALTVQPGAATFPGGSKSGCISVTPVHPDKIPMVPGFGQQPKFIVTIQPAGTTFNPPAQIAIPNSDGLKPGEITEMYGFDHDLGMFVSIGTGTASADGTLITSDRGVGVVKAGWFCGGPPADAGGAGDCPQCKKCNGTDCVADPAQDGNACTVTGTKGVCCNGNCVPAKVDVLINNTQTNSDDITALKPPQTIPVSITLHTQAACPSVHVTLSASPGGRVSFNQTGFDLTDGSTVIATVTPLAVSAAANDVTITATVNGVPVGSGHMTVVDVHFPSIRNTDTPAGVPDRIPPTANTPIQVMLQPDLTGSGQMVTLAKLNNNATNGDFNINGGATQNLTATTTVNLSGTTQTAPTGGAGGGNAGKLNLVAQVRGQNAVQSNGFSAAAIPVGIVEALVGPLTTPGLFGLIVSVRVTSDSGPNGDLSQCQFSEQIQVISETGSLVGLGGGLNSGYLTCVGTFTDSHGTSTAFLTGPGTQSITQTHIFKDARLGVTNIPIDHSGYSIARTVFENPPGSGTFHLTTSKVGAAVTANGYASSAGTPAAPMTVTQP